MVRSEPYVKSRESFTHIQLSSCRLQLTIIAPYRTKFFTECVQTCFQIRCSKTCMQDSDCEKERELTTKHTK